MSEKHNREGIRVECTRCGHMKQPRGRSAPLGAYYCDRDCKGWQQEPRVGDLWPGETCEEFGFAHFHEGTREMTPEEIERRKEANDD